MLPQSKPCVCGMTIPKEWPLCVDCQVLRDEVETDRALNGSPVRLRHVKALMLTADYRPAKERLETDTARHRLVAQVLKRRDGAKQFEAPSTELQQELFLLARKVRRQGEVKRAPQALKDWYAYGV